MEESEKIVHRIGELMFEGKFSNDQIMKIIELGGTCLNLQSISDYAKNNNMSYNGVKHHRNIKKIFNNKYVIDNY